MTNITKDYITEYIQGLTETKDPQLLEMEEYAKKHFVPIIEPEVARFLETLVKMKKPKKILEIGTAIGYSALIMYKAQPDCHITTIEIKDEMYYKAIENFQKADAREHIHSICGDGLEAVRFLEGPFDFVFLDAAKGHYKEYFDEALLRLNSGGVILSDNILFRGMVASDDLVEHRKITIVRRLREYLTYITNLEGVSTSIIPLDDGMAITIKD
ncbi:MAG: O-methyltransferase [Gallicola sp.]|uniref:O-methyltransferase n=1 Tax=Gallicola sp. Sow4_E12 TaxID=3438785 RepID=UPI0017C71BDF|nr:O-methyltransferase [Gallicola sp.]